jgi:hypothetical protein
MKAKTIKEAIISSAIISTYVLITTLVHYSNSINTVIENTVAVFLSCMVIYLIRHKSNIRARS